ncbi:hypothetical protein Kpol_1002p47 [Vanderwaltozyma polyspora DSM 70294]|uniref:SET domain-containing protein n=1 Tax=Vanderwaltozyma polyspora (strain ATCC 22028 / DSM 70294 / BCRC 21397 / CBS 2163 / NBRC 10782 / NRRL Y-8283 / UCD 57-17) TaxID=436907 RepID=A7TE78_VANPO|nr:uncharacterized protein Kpol_1002p47 [Vanderwaltozyma polyspora DSM 70294]EDO19400.1 hypothetical protein Kpol_1002p47 [Vanderwaltozyma polyspora DSM 70294]
MEDTKLHSLIEWGKQNGIQLPDGVEFIHVKNKGFCCMTTKEISNPIVNVPSNLIISKRYLDEVFPNYNENDSNSFLKVLVARMRYAGDDDEAIKKISEKFEPYIKALPSVVDSPLVWNPTEFKLLDSTNIGNSIREKLNIVFKEWFDTIQKVEGIDKTKILSQLSYHETIEELDYEEIYEKLILPIETSSDILWYSFPAFLWSHLIFTSRAFPEYIVNKTCKQNSVILLPVLDLLNHDYDSVVEWSSDNGDFQYKNMNTIPANTELTNNYGRKGNEELLSGYGFVIENNIYDSVALKIKLQDTLITKILKEEPMLQLPTISNYTWFAFDYSNGNESNNKEIANDLSEYKDGVLFFINKHTDASLNPLLNLFSYLSIHKGETWQDLRPQLEGLQNLRNALEHKVINMKDIEPSHSKYAIKTYRQYCSEIYKTSQLEILKSSISELKHIEKSWISESKNKLLTMKKVMKSDNKFIDDEIANLFPGKNQEEVVIESSFDFFVLWIISKLQNNSFIEKHKWIDEILKIEQCLPITEDARDFFSIILSNTPNVKLENVNIAMNFVESHSFTRISSDETMIVNNN